MQERAERVTVAPSSRVRTELNVGAAVVAVCISLIILALLANAPAAKPHHPSRVPAHARPAAVRAVTRP
jgi:hypothetical protein